MTSPSCSCWPTQKRCHCHGLQRCYYCQHRRKASSASSVHLRRSSRPLQDSVKPIPGLSLPTPSSTSMPLLHSSTMQVGYQLGPISSLPAFPSQAHASLANRACSDQRHGHAHRHQIQRQAARHPPPFYLITMNGTGPVVNSRSLNSCPRHHAGVEIILPSGAQLLPLGWSFSLGFAGDTFTSDSHRVYLSARLADGSPLPDWMHFDQTVTLWGLAPTDVHTAGSFLHGSRYRQ